VKRGEEWFIREDWTPYFEWLERRLFMPGRWAVIPDAPGAPSQLNDSLLREWPFGRSKGAPLWHMDAPIERLLRLCGQYDRVCLGWTGAGKDFPVGCEAWFRRMDEIAALLGNRWPVIHMMRGVLVAREYPFHSADSTSLAQNGHRYDDEDEPLDDLFELSAGGVWVGRRAYADRLERGHFSNRVRSRLSRNRAAARRPCSASDARPSRDLVADQFGLW
jgi:hypothetical protein